jgi:heparosan-N-sulfate-glucuronate 5-epimerase
MSDRWSYYRRILAAYLQPGASQVGFWHDEARVNPNATGNELGEYYMAFFAKADYAALSDAAGIPLLDYRGRIGRQYNPIAIAQWGLGNHDLYCRTRDDERKGKFLTAARWLCANLKPSPSGTWVWNHEFDWEYRTPLKAPWYSGLAQGQGISLLVRAYRQTGEEIFLETAKRAFATFEKSMGEGGVTFADERGDLWVEEYIVSPPTHILNGFMWASWGIFDYFLATQSRIAADLFAASTATIRKNLQRYDLGFWSLYEQSGKRIPMMASPFYHRLHIAQLRVMRTLTGEEIFSQYADRWEGYSRSLAKRTRALCYKGAFKLCYY